MIICTSISSLRNALKAYPAFSEKIGFVPTMGALHAGHIHLITEARKKTSVVVSSIFVNPTQFNDPADFEKYPKSVEQDALMLHNAGCDILFLPMVNEMYPHGTTAQTTYELGSMETLLEGKFRPGHFQGVCQIVHKLLDAVRPGQLILGRKDYQQCMVIQRMLQETQLPVALKIAETVRELDGLAMSSRNRRLSTTQRQQALAIFEQLNWIKAHLQQFSVAELEQKASEALINAGFYKIDYVSVADGQTLEPITVLPQQGPVVVLVAAFLGEVRLIDNMIVRL